jgi:predicted ferric reductase
MTRRRAGSIAVEREMRRLGGGPGLLGYAVVALVVGVALLLYFLDAHTNKANGGAISGRGTWFVVGEVTGITAAVLLAVTVILASRLAVLELLFGDLTKVYVAHGVIGMTMFAVVSFHPMMYLLGGLVLPKVDFLGAAHVLVPFHVVVLDWISYIAIAIALIPTMYMRLSFDWWRAVHLLLGVAMILTGYSILIDNAAFDTSAIPALRDYLYVIFGLGTAAFIWVALVRRIAEPKREYRIVAAEYHPAANAMELRAKPVGPPARFHAGQFTYVDLLDNLAQVDRDFEAHPFSIASHPGSEELSLVIEASGGHTERITTIAAEHDARALLHGAYGRLVMDRPARKKQLWLAGGIGITPFLAMADELAEHFDLYEGYEVDLIVGVDHRDQAFKLGQLEDCGKRYPGLKVHVWDREQRGLPTIAAVADLIDGDIRERAVMLSGPEPMISALTEQLLAAGVPRGQIRSERAIGPPGRWDIASPALRYTRTGVTVLFAVFVFSVAVSTVARAIAA